MTSTINQYKFISSLNRIFKKLLIDILKLNFIIIQQIFFIESEFN